MTPDTPPYAKQIGAIAESLLGKPVERAAHFLRFGGKGSMKIDLRRFTFYDFEQKVGGGAFDFVKHVNQCDGPAAVEWLKQHGFEVEERELTRERKSRAPSRAPASRPKPSHDNDDGYSPPGEVVPISDRRPFAPSSSSRQQAIKEAMRRGPTKVYPYHDAAGEVVYEACRYDFVVDGRPDKTFAQRRRPRPGEDLAKINPKRVHSGYVWQIDDVPQVLYALPTLIELGDASSIVLLVEGEKCADKLLEMGCVATTNAMGSNKWSDDLSEFFRGKRVVQLEDNDAAGRQHSQRVGKALHKIAADYRVLSFPELPEKGDVYDWLMAGGTLEGLFERINLEARPYAPISPKSSFGASTWHEIEERAGRLVDEWLVDDWIPLWRTSMLGGPSGSAKSFLALDLAIHVGMGWKWMDCKVKPGMVVYQAGESHEGVEKRIHAARKFYRMDEMRPPPFVMLKNRVDFMDDTQVDAFIGEIQAWRLYYDEPLRLVIIDTLAQAAIGVDENSAKEMGIVIANCDRVARECQCHVMMLHHMDMAGKKLRGSTAIYANVEQVLIISRDEQSDFRTVTLKKSKDGQDGLNFGFELMQVELGNRADGKLVTSCVVLPLGDKERVKEARTQGYGLTARESLAFRAFQLAVNEFGYPAPASMGLPKNVMLLSTRHWLTAYLKIAPAIDKADDRTKAAVKTLEQCSEKFVSVGILARNNSEEGRPVWWTGKPVRGFPETFRKKAERAELPAQAQAPLPDMAGVAAF